MSPGTLYIGITACPFMNFRMNSGRTNGDADGLQHPTHQKEMQ